ncbi:MAG: hypothetical protein ABI624_23605 [Casimicrobiaceae bacterium]
MNTTKELRRDSDEAANRDPLSGAPGAHPVGTGIGAAAGGIAAGAAAGAVAGPVGALAGAVVGAVVGGLGGKAIAEHYDPTVEEKYWRDTYTSEPYYQKDLAFDDYAPAYRLGGEAHGRYGDARFDEVESDLADDYERLRGESRLDWNDAKNATRAAWTRVRGEMI